MCKKYTTRECLSNIGGFAFARIAGRRTRSRLLGHLSTYFLGDQIRARLDWPSTVRAVLELSQRWPGTLAKLIEDKANGSAAIQMLVHVTAQNK